MLFPNKFSKSLLDIFDPIYLCVIGVKPHELCYKTKVRAIFWHRWPRQLPRAPPAVGAQRGGENVFVMKLFVAPVIHRQSGIHWANFINNKVSAGTTVLNYIVELFLIDFYYLILGEYNPKTTMGLKGMIFTVLTH